MFLSADYQQKEFQRTKIIYVITFQVLQMGKEVLCSYKETSHIESGWIISPLLKCFNISTTLKYFIYLKNFLGVGL